MSCLSAADAASTASSSSSAVEDEDAHVSEEHCELASQLAAPACTDVSVAGTTGCAARRRGGGCGGANLDAALVGGCQGSVLRCDGASGCPRCSCTVTFLSELALVGVARAPAAVQGDPWGSTRGGFTVLGSIDHIRTARTAPSGHIARFGYDNCVLNKR